MSNANVVVKYNLSLGSADFYWQNSKIITGFYSGVTLSSGYVKGTNYTSWAYSVASSNQVVVIAIGNGHPTMKQYFTFDQTNSFLIREEVDGTALSANWMGPVVVDYPGGVDIGSYNDVRALYVPFDNDHFVTYNAMSINGGSTGYEVAAFYDNTTRNGLVVGSVTHDTWKSGVFWSGSSNKLDQMNVFGGAQSPWDVMPHGSVTGNTITSPTMFVGFGTDWRTTMEEFADENALQTPKLAWTNGVPFGWNSWGVIQTGLTYADAINTSTVIANQLQTNHFNNNGVVYINLDSYWDNLDASQLISFVNTCHANGQKAGVYWAPFVWWGAATNATNSHVEGTGNAYTYSQALLRDGNGNFESNDGALAMDPTHPATLQRIDYFIEGQFLSYGFDYIKLDFLSHGALEGAHYNASVTTGIQAYNAGMQYVLNELNGRMFIDESIAPIFPYQYAHGRRIACDAQNSRISDTSYTLNAVTYGWWISGRLYQYNDPDIMVFTNGFSLTTNANQARLISGAITGIFLDGDSLTNAASQARAESTLTNAAIDAVAQIGRTFEATESNTGTNPASVFVEQNGATWYLAVFDYSSSAMTTNINLARAGVSGVFKAVDLWSGNSTSISGASFSVSLNAQQAKLFKLLNTPTLQSPQMAANGAFCFDLSGNAGSVYAIEATTNFTSWSTVATVTNGTDSAQVTLTNLPGRMNYYRAKYLQ